MNDGIALFSQSHPIPFPFSGWKHEAYSLSAWINADYLGSDLSEDSLEEVEIDIIDRLLDPRCPQKMVDRFTAQLIMDSADRFIAKKKRSKK